MSSAPTATSSTVLTPAQRRVVVEAIAQAIARELREDLKLKKTG